MLARHTVDFVAYNLDDLNERLDQSRSKTNQMKVFLATGDVLYSNEDNVMLTIVDQSFPYHHDMQKGTCSRKRHETKFQGLSKDNTWGVEARPRGTGTGKSYSLAAAGRTSRTPLSPGVSTPGMSPAPLNLFQNMRITARLASCGATIKTPPLPKSGSTPRCGRR